MIRAYSSLLFWLGTIIVASVMLYRTSDHVNALDMQLRTMNAQIEEEQERLHVLKAEWVYLSNPTRIEAETVRHLTLRPTELRRVASSLSAPALQPARIDSSYGIASAESAAQPQIKSAIASYDKAKVARPRNPQDRIVAALNSGRVNDRMTIRHASAENSAIIASTDKIGSLIGSLGLRP